MYDMFDRDDTKLTSSQLKLPPRAAESAATCCFKNFTYRLVARSKC